MLKVDSQISVFQNVLNDTLDKKMTKTGKK